MHNIPDSLLFWSVHIRPSTFSQVVTFCGIVPCVLLLHHFLRVLSLYLLHLIIFYQHFSICILDTINSQYILSGFCHLLCNPVNILPSCCTLQLLTWQTSCAGGRHNMPRPCKLTFDLESGVPSHVWRWLPLSNFSLPRPLCSRFRPDVRDRRQTRIIA